jgi:hypothetical protein
MDLSTGGFAFKTTSSTPSEVEVIRSVFGDMLVAADHDLKQNGMRLPGDVSVEAACGAFFIVNGEIPQKYLFKPECPSASFFEALGHPHTVIFYCHYDSGGTAGYRIFENGVPVRRRFCSESETSDEGTPRESELSWLNAEQFFEDEDEDTPPAYRNRETGHVTMEPYVTAAMLRLVMKELFGVCPWEEWSYKTRFNHYRMKPVEAPAPQAKRPWWRSVW